MNQDDDGTLRVVKAEQLGLPVFESFVELKGFLLSGGDAR